MDLAIDWMYWQNLLIYSPGRLLWEFFVTIGWIPIAIMYLFAARTLWLWSRKRIWSKDIKFILLAIDLPPNNEQSPKAVENMFSYLAGAHGTQNFFEKWFGGEYQLSFSYEIVSIEGYTQFLIRTPAQFRNLVETSVYSQYPDAEIVEVDDYTVGAPLLFPDEEYDVWGTEFVQSAKDIFPIKTYLDFEHQFGPAEAQFKDPMATLMDLCSSMRAGEQFWFQIIVIPTGFDWIKKADEEADNILGKGKNKTTFSNRMADKILAGIDWASEAVFSLWKDIEVEKKEERARSLMELKPKEKNQMEGVYRKASKLAFEAKIRVVYLARKDAMNKTKVANGIVGYMKQFATLDLNSFKPDLSYTMTRTAYFMKKSRLNNKKNRIINNYVRRDAWGGRLAGLFTIEELATIWHFPVAASVKAPMIQKAPGHKADAPASLPISEEVVEDAHALLFAPEEKTPVFDLEDLEEAPTATVKKAPEASPELWLNQRAPLSTAPARSGMDNVVPPKAAPPSNLPTA